MVTGLAKYRLPASVHVGVWIELPDAEGARFLVRLPTKYNRQYERAWKRALFDAATNVNPDGSPSLRGFDAGALDDAQVVAFVEHCIVECPEGVTKEALTGEYWPAALALFKEAKRRADAEDGEADAAGKPQPAS